jgi:hypothetical protein
MEDCTAETTLRQGEMDEALAASNAAMDSLNACTASQGIYQLGKQQRDDEVSTKTTQLAKETTLRSQQNQLFLHLEAELVAQIRAINQAITYA